MKTFALIGAAGFVAPRHMNAIKQTGNRLVAALDRSDCMGVMDSYFPDAAFFVEFERFDRHLEKLRQERADGVDYVSICSPNYLHDAHIRFALRIGADAICEKPLVLNPWNARALQKIETETGRTVNTILQLRLHPRIVALKHAVDANNHRKQFDIDLTYITARGKWYGVSWKGDTAKSGGVATNIGVHFFDMLIWIFGKPIGCKVHLNAPDKVSGVLELERARVRWFLSLDVLDIPKHRSDKGLRTFRSIVVQGREVEFSDGFADLHIESYKAILAGSGFGIEAALPSIELVAALRTAKPSRVSGDYHPMVKRSTSR